ncbi:MAG: type II secretion system F family protein [Suipraeoptans sp.]
MINTYAIVFIAIIVVIIGLILYFAKVPSGKRTFSKISIKLPWLRGLHEKIAAGRFASGMYLTISSGLSPEECLNMTSMLTDNPDFLKKVNACKLKIAEGEDLSKALLETGIFTGLYAKMTSIGSKTGSIDETMDKIADRYNDEIDQRFTSVIATLEPTLVIILSLIVGLILLSVMLPLMGILSSI